MTSSIGSYQQRPSLSGISTHSPPQSVLGKHPREESEHTPASPNNNNSATKDPPSKLFRCGDCDKSYSRVDHLARHVRNHTQERPYVCDTCGKGFARADLLKRHAAGHNVQPGDKSGKGGATSSRQSRVNQACEACAELHLKCDNVKPCFRCRTKDLFCRYQNNASETETVAQNLLSLSQTPVVEPAQMPPPSISHSHAIHANMSRTPEPGSMLHHSTPYTPGRTPMPMQYDMGPPPSQCPPPANGPHDQPQNSYLSQDALNMQQHAYSHELTGPPGLERNELHDFLRGVMGIHTTDPMTATNTAGYHNRSGQWTPGNHVYDLGVDNNLELNDVDLGFLDTYNQYNPFGITPEGAQSVVESNVSETASEPPLGVESLQKASIWRFRPLPEDTAGNNLVLPHTDSAATKKLLSERRVTQEMLPYTIRDQILAMIITAGADNRSVLSFPSVELLDSLLQFFLSGCGDASIDLFHIPTFRPSQNRPELCAAMIAVGASRAPDTALRKLGMVIQETIRLALPKALDIDNSLVRDVRMVQAAYLALKVGFWSGNSRKMELSEGLLQPLTTMMRRGGWFGRKYGLIVPSPEDSNEILEQKWRKWIEQESRKKLCYHLFVHDTVSSMSLFINPNISFAEMTLPLPHPGQLWQAKTAQLWRKAYLTLKDPHTQPPSTLDLLNNIDLYYATQPHCAYDRRTATYALLSASWRLIWDYRQNCAITSNSVPNQWNNGTLLLSSRLEELKRLLECLRTGTSQNSLAAAASSKLYKASPLKPFAPAATHNSALFLLDALSLHLHAPLEDLHTFAGVEGHEEAKRVYHSLRTWAGTSGARQAVWYAAQVFHSARAIEVVSDFDAVLVYQASLVVWSWGVISNAITNSTPTQTPIRHGGQAYSPSAGSGLRTPVPTSYGPGVGMAGDPADSFGGTPTYPWLKEDIVLLDDPSSDEAGKRFVAMNRGRPAITVPANSTNGVRRMDGDDGQGQARRYQSGTAGADPSPGYALLTDPAAVMGCVMDLIASSHKIKNSRPPLVDNLLELMGGLKAAVSVGN